MKATLVALLMFHWFVSQVRCTSAHNELLQLNDALRGTTFGQIFNQQLPDLEQTLNQANLRMRLLAALKRVDPSRPETWQQQRAPSRVPRPPAPPRQSSTRLRDEFQVRPGARQATGVFGWSIPSRSPTPLRTGFDDLASGQADCSERTQDDVRQLCRNVAASAMTELQRARRTLDCAEYMQRCVQRPFVGDFLVRDEFVRANGGVQRDETGNFNPSGFVRPDRCFDDTDYCARTPLACTADHLQEYVRKHCPKFCGLC